MNTIENRELYSCLSMASFMGLLDVVKLLLEKGAELKHRTILGETPVHLAAKSNQLQVLKYFVEELKQPLDAVTLQNETPLWLACATGALNTVKYLVENGACLNSSDKDGVTPSEVAKQSGHLAVSNYLINKNTG